MKIHWVNKRVNADPFFCNKRKKDSCLLCIITYLMINDKWSATAEPSYWANSVLQVSTYHINIIDLLADINTNLHVRMASCLEQNKTRAKWSTLFRQMKLSLSGRHRSCGPKTGTIFSSVINFNQGCVAIWIFIPAMFNIFSSSIYIFKWTWKKIWKC